MKTLKEQLALKMAEALELRAKALDEASEFTEADADRADTLVLEMDELRTKIAKQEGAVKALQELPSLELPTGSSQKTDSELDQDLNRASKSAGDLFVESAGFQAFKERYPKGIAKGDTSTQISIKAENLGPGVTGKAILRRPTTGNARAVRTNEVDDMVYRAPRTLLDVITRGTTNLNWFQYRQIVSKTNNAAIVPEASSTTSTVTGAGSLGYKPVSDLTTALAEAREFTYADGMEVTNQELSDDGIMRSIIDSTLRENLEIKVESVLLNGAGTADEPAGILNTTGVLQQAFVTDAPTSLRKSITKLRVTSNAPIRGILMNPEDDEMWDLLKDSHGDWISGPYAPGPGTAWGYERIVSQSIPVGKAIVGDFSTIHLLQYSPLEILAFNQHADFARRNMTYIRAEERALQLIRNAARLCVVKLNATVV